MTRRAIALTALVLIAALVGWDLSSSAPLNRFDAPPMIALGSGTAAGGAHCASLPATE